VVYQDQYNSFKATVMTFGYPNEIKNIYTHTQSITISPNPNYGSFTLNIPSPTKEDATIIITNMLGQQVKELTTTTNMKTQVQLSASPGIYFITATTNAQTITSKIIVQ
jgi:phosphoribosyl-dephospho-CoA transferase